MRNLCPRVRVTASSQVGGTESGEYFQFDVGDMLSLLGIDGWEGEEQSIKDKDISSAGSNNYRGKIQIWNNTNGYEGRRSTDKLDGQWAVGDTIHLQSCTECGQEQYSGKYCAKSDQDDCDGTTCTELALNKNSYPNIDECIEFCRRTAGCQYMSYTLSSAQCILFDECPAGKQHGDDQSTPTSTIRVCAKCHPPCLNSGYCNVAADGSKSCACPPGYGGRQNQPKPSTLRR